MDRFKWDSVPDSVKYSQVEGNSAGDYVKRLNESFYEQLEATILNIMAAGVPLSSIKLSAPELVIKDDIATLNSTIKFK